MHCNFYLSTVSGSFSSDSFPLLPTTDGSIYEGESVNNYFEGEGIMTWEDGGYYEGEWSQGEIDGYGKEIRPNGSIRHEGLWRNGFPVRK
jgi:hypothetical protein